MKRKKTVVGKSAAGSLSKAVENLLPEIRGLIEEARHRAVTAANLSMVTLYWNLGRVITKDIQRNSKRAGYGEGLLASLALRLPEEYGRGFSRANLQDMRRFYVGFKICQPVASKLLSSGICQPPAGKSPRADGFVLGLVETARVARSRERAGGVDSLHVQEAAARRVAPGRWTAQNAGFGIPYSVAGQKGLGGEAEAIREIAGGWGGAAREREAHKRRGPTMTIPKLSISFTACRRSRIFPEFGFPVVLLFLALTILLGEFLAFSAEVNTNANPSPGAQAVLGIRGARFTLNGQPTFLLGISYYGGLGAPEEFIRRDLEDIQHNGFNWLRVWATWESSGSDVSAVDNRGRPREPFLGKLKWLVAECDHRGLIVDVTLTRGKGRAGTAPIGRLPDFSAHQQAVETLVNALKAHRNWYLDLANERDVRDDRYVSPRELKALRELVRRLDPSRLLTASFGGHDLTEGDLRDALLTIGLDFLAPHRPRGAESPGQTEAKTCEYLDLMKRIGRVAPVHYQEPFRRGYTDWDPLANDFLADLRGAIVGGAAGWCFHNGLQRNTPDHEPRRSFDLQAKRLFDQLDVEERQVVDKAAAQLTPSR